MKMKLKILGVYLDGGTKRCVDIDDGQEYFIDNRIRSTTKGQLFDRYPDKPNAQIVNIEYTIIENEHTTTKPN